MSGKKKSPKNSAGCRKKQNKKRQATSPLNENSSPVLNTSDKSNNNSNNSEHNKGQSKKTKKSKKVLTLGDSSTQNVTQNPSVGYSFDHYQQAMAFQQGFGPMSQPSFTSPSAQFSGGAFGAFQPPSAPPPAPPPWATELLEEVKQIKTKLQSIDEIKKTVNSINAKVCDLETKMKSLDTRVNETEKSCQFSANQAESNKNELKTAKDEIKNLRKKCADFEKESSSLKQKNAEIDTKLTDLESRSMRENLLFYGIAEGGEKEDCGKLVKKVIRDILHIPNPDDILFDRVHRVGQRSTNARPIVVKFHYYTDREKIRMTSFACAAELKAANLGIGAQLPKSIRDARKSLYPAMKKAKDEGKDVKFAGKKMFIDGHEYVHPAPAPSH